MVQGSWFIVHSKNFVVVIGMSLLCLILPQTAQAATYYCDPVNGNTATGDGSAEHPWGTLQSVGEAGKFNGAIIKSGDTVRLRTGFHGNFGDRFGYAMTIKNTDYITIEADTNAVADVNFVIMIGGGSIHAKYWHFKGLRISPSFSDLSETTLHELRDRIGCYGYMIFIPSCSYITFEDCNIFTTSDVSSWTPDDWRDSAFSSIWAVYSSHMILHGNHIHNVASGPRAIQGLIEQNLIDGFCIDALTAQGTGTIIQDNIITNVYDDNEPGTHSDAMHVSGDNIRIRHNYINGRTDPNNKLTSGSMIGINTASGGPLNNSVIENNVIIISANNLGIGIGDNSHDTRIINNTVIAPYASSMKPGVMSYPVTGGSRVYGADLYEYYCISTHTSGEVDEPNVGASWTTKWLSTGSKGASKTWVINTKYTAGKTGGMGYRNIIIRNNIADAFMVDSNHPPSPKPFYWDNIVVDHNPDIISYNRLNEFIDYVNGNVHLAANSNFIDTGSSSDAPDEDLDRNSRPQGQGYDIGAYEYGASTFLYGDVNSDGEISAYDAALTAQAAVDLITLTPEQTKAADVNSDREVTAYDAALIAQRAVGLIEKFPVE
jgi:hypothetical protein